MKKSVRTLFVVAAGVFALSVPVLAHHGTAAYETDKNVSIEGTVMRFEFSNPHAILAVNTKDPKGNTREWQAELTSPNHLVRAGWTSKTLKFGDRITISGFPAKSGAETMWIRKIAKADGQVLSLGGGADN